MAIDPSLVTTASVGELPLVPITLESKIPHELGGVLNHNTVAQFLELLVPLVGKMPYEAVTLIVDAEYISENFDLEPGATMGLGINLCAGFAIRNGNNGTDNADGRVDIGYGINYDAIGAVGGSKDAVVVSHDHLNGLADGQQTLFVYGATMQGMPGLATSCVDNFGEARTYQGRTSTTGVSGVNKNMQPYRVVLKIMKLP